MQSSSQLVLQRWKMKSIASCRRHVTRCNFELQLEMAQKIGPYTAMRMRNVTILKFHGGQQFKWIFRLKIALFEESLSVLPFQINLTIICQRKNCEEFRRTCNCDPVLLCTSTDMETIWAWCVVLIRQFF